MIVNWVRYIILAVFLAFVFVALSKAQTTHDFGVWYSAGMEKKISADWNAGIGTELRTKHRREYIDRWKLDIHSTYRIHRYLKLGAAYEFHLKNQTTGSETISLQHHLRSRMKAVMAMAQSKWEPFTSAEMFNNMGEGFTIDEIRLTVGTEHRFNLCHSCCRIPS